MRIDSLDLVAFGPFSGTRLDFGAYPRALQLVYGPNEAGKSTTLRALVALLYGIPERTSDAHLHEMGKLRLAATLRGADGKRLSIVRRKGRKQTLLDAEQRPLDENVLRRMLGGLDESLYRQLFGLDHERLRLGAEALLQGGGGVGEGLFDAGTGGRTIHAALTSLREEADSLYRPKGQRKLNVALNALRERQKERKEAMLSPQSFDEQRRALSQALETRDGLRQKKAALLTEQAELTLNLRAVPLTAQRAQLALTRRALGDVLLVSSEALSQAKALELERTELLAEISRLTAQRAEALRLREALPSVDPVRLSPELSRDLTERLGLVRSAERDLPRLRGELDGVERDIAAIRARLGQTLEKAMHLDVARRARLRTVAEELRQLESELKRAERDRRAAEALCTQLAARRATLGELAHGEELSLLLRAQDPKQLKAELLRVEAQLARQRRELEQGLSQLGIERSVQSLARVALPFSAELEQVLQALDLCERQAADLERKREASEAEKAALVREMTLLSAEGEPVTEDDLAEARHVRERFWSGLAADLRTGTGPVLPERLRAFEAAQRASDRVADRLRSESGRAGMVLQQRARLTLLEGEAQRLAEQQRATHALRLQHLTHLESLWRPAGITLRAPRDMLQVCERLAKLRSLAAEHEQTLAECDAQRARSDTWSRELGEAMARLGKVLAPEASLELVLREAEELSARENARALDIKTVSQELNRAERELSQHAAHVLTLEARVSELKQQLGRELSALGLHAELSAHEALACLEELMQLEVREREAQGMTQRIALLSDEQRAFADEVTRLLHSYGMDAEGSVPELVTLLTERAERARDVERDRLRLTAQIDALSTQLSGLQGKLQSYENSLATQLTQLGVSEVSELTQLEERFVRSERLKQAEQQNEAELSALAAGVDLLALCARASELKPAEARVRIQEIEGSLEALDEEMRDVDQAIGRIGVGVSNLTQSEGAGPRAEEAEAELANVQHLSRRYIEVRLALSILSREVERYREAHQGPVLLRASALFPRLTLDRYRGLDVDYADDDTPRLCALREDGVRVHVEGLSDGTRDQLYLALRVASLERFLARNTPLPLVLDDILVHFDDARSEAALKVLSELATHTQVLFFTHHARIVELAKRSLSQSQLCVHMLRGPGRGAQTIRDDGPLFDRG